ncbi:MAG: hypothetical protein ACOYZ6_06755 [Chloroflexota bacterium]
MKLTFVLRFTLLTLLLTSCSALERPTLGTATPVPPTVTPLLSPTVVWFPPTETPTPSVLTAPTATPDYMPGLGRTLYTDDFTDPASWSDLGTDYIRDGRLTLAASDGTYLTTLHNDLILSDFYAEVTAHLSLCRAADEYGLLVRAIPTSYYRFSVSCNGELKADRITNSQRVPLKLPYPTLDAPRGSPAEVTLAVWAVGRELRFFVNGHYQFSVDDPVFPSGSLGFFVRAAEDSPVTVSFTDLVVRAVSPNQ